LEDFIGSLWTSHRDLVKSGNEDLIFRARRSSLMKKAAAMASPALTPARR
jgi:hypothetical protein